MHTRIGAGDDNHAVRDVQLLGDVPEAEAESNRVEHGGEKGERESGRERRETAHARYFNSDFRFELRTVENLNRRVIESKYAREVF